MRLLIGNNGTIKEFFRKIHAKYGSHLVKKECVRKGREGLWEAKEV